MSAQKLSRAYAQGEIKKLRRMKQPLVLKLEASGPPRNPVATALDRLRWASAVATGFRGGPEASSLRTRGCFMRRSFLISPWA